MRIQMDSVDLADSTDSVDLTDSAGSAYLTIQRVRWIQRCWWIRILIHI